VSEPCPISERRDADDDGIVRLDHDPRGEFRRAIGGSDHLRAAERKIESDRKTAAGGGGTNDERAAIQFRDEFMTVPLTRSWWPYGSLRAPAGRCRQRQILVIAASMSASVGFRLLLDERRNRHDHAALTIPALRYVVSTQAFAPRAGCHFWQGLSMVVICLPTASLT